MKISYLEAYLQNRRYKSCQYLENNFANVKYMLTIASENYAILIFNKCHIRAVGEKELFLEIETRLYLIYLLVCR